MQTVFTSLTNIAHDIRDHTRLSAKAMRHLEANSRWALIGTPIQNNLSDLSSLYQFLRAYPYNEPRIFKEHIARLCSHQRNDAILKIKRLISCIMLRRSIATITLPERQDLVCRLHFSPEEAAVYNRAKTCTLELLGDAIGGSDTGTSQLNVLLWINSLRMICNLGTRAKIPKTNSFHQNWDKRTAQEMFNSLIIAGSVNGRSCFVDLGAVATEVADQVCGESSQPQLSSCSHLICGPCWGKLSGKERHCGHFYVHQMIPVSTLSSSLSTKDDHVIETDEIPTKIQALMQDLDQHVEHEKWYVTEIISN